MEPRNVELITIRKEDRQQGQYENIEYWKVVFGEKCNEGLDLLYDLIKANLVIKE